MNDSPIHIATQAQRRAAHPDQSVWVNASAGTGKTKVLTERVLRLLLPRPDGRPGTAPHKILCLTYTRAAASEMAERLLKRVSAWAVMPEAELAQNLAQLTGGTPDNVMITAARRLFYQLVDGPDQVRLMTIHAFCQSVLARFPLEAGVPPHFSLIEGEAAKALLSDARQKVLLQAERDPILSDAVKSLAAIASEDGIQELMDDLLMDAEALRRSLLATPAAVRATTLATILGLEVNDHLTTWEKRVGSPAPIFLADLTQLAGGLQTGVAREKEMATAIQNWTAYSVPDRALKFNNLMRVFIKQNGERYQDGSHAGARKKNPDLAALYINCGDLVAALAGERDRLLLKAANLALLTLAERILIAYDDLKQTHGVLDFQDLISFTGRLLRQDQASHTPSWVRYKMDGGIDHILVDEAQDTNPDQWALIAQLVQSFGDDPSRDRTIFVVGDQKQSIYRFQGADPDIFADMLRQFGAVSGGGITFDRIPLNTSFRTVAAVLNVVDQMYVDATARVSLGLCEPLVHVVKRVGQGGQIDLWPQLSLPENTEPKIPWDPPVTIKPRRDMPAKLAEQVARLVRGWLDSREMLPSHNRPIEPQDIMILVRKRAPWLSVLQAALRSAAVPVAGLDRQILTDHLAVKDVLSLMRFAVLPTDDLSLACFLKSPLVGLDEDALMNLAFGRNGSLWAALQADPQFGDIVRYCQKWFSGEFWGSPYRFINNILSTPCAAGNGALSGEQALRSRLGDDVGPVLIDLQARALGAEQAGKTTLQFLGDLDQNTGEVKRDMMRGENAVRLLTVHGAKGLESPIVILPDTIITHHDQKDPTLFWPDDTGQALPLWVPRRPAQIPALVPILERGRAAEQAEYERLLYVAATRAGDRLVVMAARQSTEPDPQSWYFRFGSAIDRLANTKDYSEEQTPIGPVRSIKTTQTVDPDGAARAARLGIITPSKGGPINAAPLTPLPVEPPIPRPLRATATPALDPVSPLQVVNDPRRFLRGQLIHKLLQILPDLPLDRRQAAATTFLAHHTTELTEGAAGEIWSAVNGVLTHPDFTTWFGHDSRAEVAVTGLLPDGRLLSGQIDRLVVLPDRVVIIDYKTNRPAPTRVDEVPAAYRMQLAAYRAALAAIYPGRTITTCLLWTEGPHLMEINP